jgi:hypothetical protein
MLECPYRVAGWLAVAFCLIGCEEETGPTVQVIPFESYAQAFHDALCDHAVACSFMPDRETCLAVVGPPKNVTNSVAAVTAGVLTYDNIAGGQCVAAIRNASCDGSTLYSKAIRQACDPVFGGRKGEGEACANSAECEGIDAACEGCTNGCCMGTCKLAAGTAKLGEACAEKECDSTSSYCAPDMMGTLVCTAKVGPGETCPSDTACTEGYACDPGTQTCFKQAASGAACNPDLASDGCLAIAEYCDATTRKCTPYPGAGKACGVNALASNICAAYAYCDGSTMMCTALPGAGEPCPLNACIGEYLGDYGLSPVLRCSSDDGSGTCETRAPQTCQ